MANVNHDRINQLVLQYQKETDQQKKDEIFDKIYQSQKRMINMFISSSAIQMGQSEDLEQELLYAMLECINKFKRDKGANFNTYLLFYLKKGRTIWSTGSRTVKVNQHAKGNSKNISFINIDSPIGEDQGQELTIKDIIADKLNWDDIDNRIDLNTRLEKFCGTDKDIILKFLDGYKLPEIAQELNLDKEYVVFRFYKILKTLKEYED